MNEEEAQEYFLDGEGYYVTRKTFKGKITTEKCPKCGRDLDCIYAEKYLHFEIVGILMIAGVKIYRFECEACGCYFIPRDE